MSVCTGSGKIFGQILESGIANNVYLMMGMSHRKVSGSQKISYIKKNKTINTNHIIG